MADKWNREALREITDRFLDKALNPRPLAQINFGDVIKRRGRNRSIRKINSL